MAPLEVRPSDAERDRSICRVQVRRRPPGRRDLVATGWLSPSYSEGDTPVVAIRLFWLLFCLAVFRLLVPCRVCRRWPAAPPGFPGGVPCVPVPAGLVLAISQLCRFYGDCPACSLFARCSALEGLSHLEVVSVPWDPHPREPVEGVLRATSVLELAAHTSAFSGSRFGVLLASQFRSRVPVRGGTNVCRLPTSWRVQGPEWFCVWALDLVEVLPRIALCHFWWRFFPGVLRVRFEPPLCCPYGSKGVECNTRCPGFRPVSWDDWPLTRPGWVTRWCRGVGVHRDSHPCRDVRVRRFLVASWCNSSGSVCLGVDLGIALGRGVAF
ncbi:hypothetical protein Taro_000919 [Colocasia esculenta]|uniref:Uncharacterized protein n=1 Tax=Colocasia esculenta TaxID=4460 RepID=A0A843TEP7_COLES|nr:hypothetical protein [Colocasia esculenta]